MNPWPAVRIALAAALACVAAASAASAGAAHAGPAPSAQAPFVHAVTAAARAEANRYWTKARMESATARARARDGAVGAPSPARPAAIPSPVHFAGVPTVGALFFTTGKQSHFCTASVVDSPHGDIVLTAAHCVYTGSYATNIAYVPQWHDGLSPHGIWAVTSITVAQGWVSAQDPDLDFAFLAVAPPRSGGTPVQAVTGGLTLGVNAGFGHEVYVIGYNDTDSEPVGCSTTSAKFTPTQMRLYCNGYQDGTSGGPWILDFHPAAGRGTVVGDIGGYEQGGASPSLSYSPYYGSSLLRLFKQAQRGH